MAQVMCLILKAADISNPSRPLPIYQRWITGVMSEFFTQGDAERAAGLPCSLNCDRHTVVEAKAQVRISPASPPPPAVRPLARPLCAPAVRHRARLNGATLLPAVCADPLTALMQPRRISAGPRRLSASSRLAP